MKNEIKIYLIFKWLFFVLALIMLGVTILTYLEISSQCISSSCSDEFCTDDCEGSRSYMLAIYSGIIDIIFWNMWILIKKKIKKF